VAQSAAIGAMNEIASEKGVVVCAAGSLPGDRHKLWRCRDSKSYHLQYGYSCVEHEIAGGLGVKMADPSRTVYLRLGDGSHLTIAQELHSDPGRHQAECDRGRPPRFRKHRRADPHLRQRQAGTRYPAWSGNGLDGGVLNVDFVANAASLGVKPFARRIEDLESALTRARDANHTTVEGDPEIRVPGYESCWDVAVAGVSESDTVQRACEDYEIAIKVERHFSVNCLTMPGYAVGVDLGGTNLRVAIVDDQGGMVEKLVTPTVELRTSECVIARMCEHIQQLRRNHKSSGPLHGIGIAIPGIIDLETGILRESPNLPGWYDYPVREEIERRLGAKVILENDANAAAMGEFWLGAAREYDSTCMLTLGTGVGGGIIIKGALWHGMTGMAGEPGHMTVDPEGAPCPCGNHGCLEQFAGATAIVRMAKESAERGEAPAIRKAIERETQFSARSVYEIAMKGDTPAQRIFERSGRALGIAISSMINLLNLPIYIIGGGGSGGWDAFSPYIFEEVEQRSFIYRATMQELQGGRKRPRTRITRAMLGSDAGIFGAARLPMLPEEVYEHSLHQGTPAVLKVAREK